MRPIVVVSYSSLERSFIDVLLRECVVFASKVVVAYGTRLYTGAEEDLAHVADLAARHDEVTFVPYPVGLDELDDPVRLHNRSRVAALRTVRPRADDWILFLDADEVPDGLACREFFQAGAEAGAFDSPNRAFKLANYWYFLRTTLRATEVEDSVLLVHSSWLADPDAIWHPRERDGIVLHNLATRPLQHSVERNVVSKRGKPMFHHFSWVRPRPDLIAKVRGWGHRGQRDWEALLHEAWNTLDSDAGMTLTRDFVHGYELEAVPPPFTDIFA